MNLTFFWQAWKLDFLAILWVYTPLLGVYPSSLALAHYWSHLVLSLGFTPLTTWGLPPTWAPPHVSRQRGKPSNRFNNEFDHFLAGVEIGFLVSTWGLPPWSYLGGLLESSTWGLPPLAAGLPS